MSMTAFAAWTAAAPGAGGAGAARGLRVSLGAQSFSPDLREALGRRAQADPAEAFRSACAPPAWRT